VRDVLGSVPLVPSHVPLDFLLLGGDGFFAGAVELAVTAVSADLVETLLADDIEPVIPEGVAIVLAVGLNLAVCPAYDDLQAVKGDVSLLVEGVDQDADNFGAVGEVDVGVFALAAAHYPGVDGVPGSQVFGDNGGVLFVDVSVLHFCVPLYRF